GIGAFLVPWIMKIRPITHESIGLLKCNFGDLGVFPTIPGSPNRVRCAIRSQEGLGPNGYGQHPTAHGSPVGIFGPGQKASLWRGQRLAPIDPIVRYILGL